LDAGCEADKRIITLNSVEVRQASVSTHGSRLRRKRKAGESEQDKKQTKPQWRPANCLYVWSYHSFGFILVGGESFESDGCFVGKPWSTAG